MRAGGGRAACATSAAANLSWREAGTAPGVPAAYLPAREHATNDRAFAAPAAIADAAHELDAADCRSSGAVSGHEHVWYALRLPILFILFLAARPAQAAQWNAQLCTSILDAWAGRVVCHKSILAGYSGVACAVDAVWAVGVGVRGT